MYSTILFDLDGTLTDPWEGITRCVQHALAAFGIDEPQENLTTFIGPPLRESFMERYGFTAAEATEAVRVYRERFGTKGLYENGVYPGVPALLDRLKDAGLTLAIATAKPEEYTGTILEHFQLSGFFDIAVGSNMDCSRTQKREVVHEVLRRLGHPDPQATVMVGDRRHDVEGARAEGIDSIAVTWGYAPEGELEAAGPTRFAHSLAELEALLLGAPHGESPAIAGRRRLAATHSGSRPSN